MSKFRNSVKIIIIIPIIIIGIYFTFTYLLGLYLLVKYPDGLFGKTGVFVVKDLTPDEIKLLQKGGGFNIPEGAEVVAAGWVAGKNGKVSICLKGITDIDGFIGFQDDIINGVKKLYSNDRKSISMNNER